MTGDSLANAIVKKSNPYIDSFKLSVARKIPTCFLAQHAGGSNRLVGLYFNFNDLSFMIGLWVDSDRQ